MSTITSEINRIKTNINDSLDAVAAYGVEILEGDNSDNLASRISEIGNSFVKAYDFLELFDNNTSISDNVFELYITSEDMQLQSLHHIAHMGLGIFRVDCYMHSLDPIDYPYIGSAMWFTGEAWYPLGLITVTDPDEDADIEWNMNFLSSLLDIETEELANELKPTILPIFMDMLHLNTNSLEERVSNLEEENIYLRADNNGHEYVDLGLRSGTLWATCNVGADNPEDCGDYYAWGETETKSNYDWSTYKWCNGSETTMTKYCTSSSYGTVDNKTTLDPEDDVAHVKWGGDWRMPTADEQRELLEQCTWTWTTRGGKNGYLVISTKNENSIFLPVAGYLGFGLHHNANSKGDYWSSSLYSRFSNGAYEISFNSSVATANYNGRHYGQSVRPVLIAQGQVPLKNKVIELDEKVTKILNSGKVTIDGLVKQEFGEVVSMEYYGMTMQGILTNIPAQEGVSFKLSNIHYEDDIHYYDTSGSEGTPEAVYAKDDANRVTHYPTELSGVLEYHQGALGYSEEFDSTGLHALVDFGLDYMVYVDNFGFELSTRPLISYPLKLEVSSLISPDYVESSLGNNTLREDIKFLKENSGKSVVASITYNELKSLRDNSKLVSGTWYRITDYECETFAENTQSARHQFDILVLAVSENELNENALACHHDGDEYFKNNNLNAWRLKYELDASHDWAKVMPYFFVDDDSKYVRYPEKDRENEYAWCYEDPEGEVNYDNIVYTSNIEVEDGDTVMRYDEELEIYNSSQGGTASKGCVYWLCDEFENECGYDFKNIQFKRKRIENNIVDSLVGKYSVESSKAGTLSNNFVWCYTFNSWDEENDEIENGDSSLKKGVYMNKLIGKGTFNNVFFGNTCCCNTFGTNCYNNTFGINCCCNTFGINCYYNIFGNHCNGNAFGNNFWLNIFGDSCYNNTFGDFCSSNTFGACFNFNTFGNYCLDNMFGNHCNYITFGNKCYRNTFGSSSSMQNYMCYVTLDNDVLYTYINCSATTSLSSYGQNIHVNSGVHGTSNTNRKTLTIATAGNKFLTIFKSANDTEITV